MRFNRVPCNFQNVVAAMTVGRSYLHEPESCICPTCKSLMRLSRVPALKALDATEFYFKCDDCDYTSAQLTEIISNKFVCEIHREADFRPAASDLWCGREIAELVRAAGARSEDRPPRAGQSPPILSLPPVDESVPTRDSIDPDKRIPAPMLRRPGYALPSVTTFGVASAIAAALAGYFVVASLTGSGAEPEVQIASLQPTMRSENESETALDSENRATVDLTNGIAHSTNQESLRNKTSPVLDAPDMKPPTDERGRLSFAAGDMVGARLLSTPANAGDATPAVVDQAGFLFAESNVRYLTRAELEKLSADQLRISRNEIFARKGRFFKSHQLRAHFAKFVWYQPSVWRIRLNQIEQANVGLIRSLEAPPTTPSVASWRPPT
jgi:hypothetical protein